MTASGGSVSNALDEIGAHAQEWCKQIQQRLWQPLRLRKSACREVCLQHGAQLNQTCRARGTNVPEHKNTTSTTCHSAASLCRRRSVKAAWMSHGSRCCRADRPEAEGVTSASEWAAATSSTSTQPKPKGGTTGHILPSRKPFITFTDSPSARADMGGPSTKPGRMVMRLHLQCTHAIVNALHGGGRSEMLADLNKFGTVCKRFSAVQTQEKLRHTGSAVPPGPKPSSQPAFWKHSMAGLSHWRFRSSQPQ